MKNSVYLQRSKFREWQQDIILTSSLHGNISRVMHISVVLLLLFMTCVIDVDQEIRDQKRMSALERALLGDTMTEKRWSILKTHRLIILVAVGSLDRSRHCRLQYPYSKLRDTLENVNDLNQNVIHILFIDGISAIRDNKMTEKAMKTSWKGVATFFIRENNMKSQIEGPKNFSRIFRAIDWSYLRR